MFGNDNYKDKYKDKEKDFKQEVFMYKGLVAIYLNIEKAVRGRLSCKLVRSNF